MAVHLIIQQENVLGTVAGIMALVGLATLWMNCQRMVVIHAVQDFTALITNQVAVE